MLWPDFVQKHMKSAEALISKGLARDIIFSEGTYQVEIIDQEPLWPFLQIDDEGTIQDAFCTCEKSEETEGCKHLAAAYLHIYNHQDFPLHVRFRTSFWNKVFKVASKRHGYETKVLKKIQPGTYACESKTKKRLIHLEAHTQEAKEKLDEIIGKRVLETEETSLKFSNLSTEEISSWKEGKASHQLRYELSFWSDLAKWCMMLQEEKKPYRVTYSPINQEVPSNIAVSFELLSLEFYVAKAYWTDLIPSLKTIDSNLKIYEKEAELTEIRYDVQKKSFHIDSQKFLEGKKESSMEGEVIGEWLYLPNQGFFHQRPDPLLEKKEIPAEEIADILTNYTKTLEKYLINTTIQIDPIKPKYQVYFDKEYALHIRSYLFEIGDMQKPYSEYFPPWVYLQDRGFYRLEETLLEEKERIVPFEQVSDFINKHRVWLHDFDGFQTHIRSMESHLIFKVLENGDMQFDSELEFPEEFEGSIDFGEWIYIKGQGFYLKKEGRGILPLRPGLIVKKNEVSEFIRANKEDLNQITGFFTAESPIENLGLKIFLNKDNRIAVEPEIKYKLEYKPDQLYFYEDYIYIQKKGFYPLPHQYKLPDRYRKEMLVSVSEEPFFLNYELESLQNFISYLDPRLKKPQYLDLKIRKILIEKRRGIKFWLIDLVYESELGKVEATELYEALQSRKKFLYSSAGLIPLKHARFSWLRNLPKRRLHPRHKILRLTTLEWIRLCIFEQIEEPKDNSESSVQTRKFLEELKTFETDKLLDISYLKSKLRPYQELGLRWLWFLYCHELSGLLCDEMGLGKTHQAMALLAAVMHEDHDRHNKYLVACPTSVIYHWVELLKNFLPEIKVCVYHGVSRTLLNFEEKYDLLLTSYGILRTGKENFKSYKFELAIFDEVQIAKNHTSQTHKALSRVRSKMRLGLTGTPIENRLRELKALYDLILPSYLPSDTIFREFFSNPIEKFNDEEKRSLLTNLIKPFILRRKKAEVLLDLPEKIEEIAYCDLSDEQQRLYQEVLEESKKQLIDDLRNRAKPVPYMHVFSLLSKLKQICNHPSLYLKDIRSKNKHQSGKWDLFVELLNETRDSGQKLVIFSQYLDMLTMIESHLKKKGIGFAGIKGSTKDRHAQLKKFKEDPQCEVFIASLLAAGVGIELSSASVVIHYDRWWNPAKENQATDRVHRIGQNRGVQVFKLVTKNTIEEHIHALIEKKMGLIEETIGKDDSDQIKVLSREELIEILQKTYVEEASF